MTAAFFHTGKSTVFVDHVQLQEKAVATIPLKESHTEAHKFCGINQKNLKQMTVLCIKLY